MDKSLILAIYGAILSTILVIREIAIAVVEFTKRKRRLKLSISRGVTGITKKNKKSKLFILLSATNIGNRPITIEEVAVQHYYSKKLKNNMAAGSYGYTGWKRDMFNQQLPQKLEDGDKIVFYLDYHELFPSYGQIVYFYFLDTDGTQHKVRPDKEFKRWLKKQEKQNEQHT